MRFKGVVFRAHDPRWSFLPVSGDGAAIHGGRFNPTHVPALYLALDPMTAVKEANLGFAQKFEPCVLCSYDIDCDHIVDLTTRAARMRSRVLAREIGCAWHAHLARGEDPPSWAVARRLIAEGAAGILVPSYAPGAMPNDKNLVLWKWNSQLPHKITVFDPSGRLPKNQLSWT